MNWKGTEGPGRQARFGLCNLDNPSETQKAMRGMEEENVMNKMKRSTNLSAAIPSSSFTSKCSNRLRRFPSNTILGARGPLGYFGNHITCTPAPGGVRLRGTLPRILILLWSSILRRFHRADLPVMLPSLDHPKIPSFNTSPPLLAKEGREGMHRGREREWGCLGRERDGEQTQQESREQILSLI